MRIVRQLAKQLLPQPLQLLLRIVILRGRAFTRAYRFSFPAASQQATRSPFSCTVARHNVLETLGEKHQPSKRMHNYLPYYWMHFRDIRLEVRHVLEIGVETGRSLQMWEEFFPNATIYGVDHDPRCGQYAADRRLIFIGDQSDRRFLESVVAQARGPFDIIIDDGSHRPEHQLKTFEFLFPVMSDHGIYVIEDTGLGDGLWTVNSLKCLIDQIMFWPEGLPPGDWPYVASLPDGAGWAAKHIIGIAFYRWIVFVMRGQNPEDNPYLQKLRGQ